MANGSGLQPKLEASSASNGAVSATNYPLLQVMRLDDGLDPLAFSRFSPSLQRLSLFYLYLHIVCRLSPTGICGFPPSLTVFQIIENRADAWRP